MQMHSYIRHSDGSVSTNLPSPALSAKIEDSLLVKKIESRDLIINSYQALFDLLAQGSDNRIFFGSARRRFEVFLLRRGLYLLEWTHFWLFVR